jgi:hypothetical protein
MFHQVIMIIHWTFEMFYQVIMIRHWTFEMFHQVIMIIHWTFDKFHQVIMIIHLTFEIISLGRDRTVFLGRRARHPSRDRVSRRQERLPNRRDEERNRSR